MTPLHKRIKRRPSVLLIERLRREGDIPQEGNAFFERLRPGYWQRSEGAWSWLVTCGAIQVGSADSVAACLKSKEWKWSGDELIP